MVYRIYTVLQAPALLNSLLQAGAFLGHSLTGTPAQDTSDSVNNRIDIEHRNLFIPANVAGVQCPGTTVTVHAKGIENRFQVLLSRYDKV